jgi:hypothetical protein
MGIFVFWVIMAFVVAIAANGKGFSGFGWFIYGLLIWPVALIHVLVARPNTKVVEAEQLRSGDSQKCPFCAELIKREAVVCRYCGRDLKNAPQAALNLDREAPANSRDG